ncbi:MAG: hypothetical protein WAV20_15365 [Blastocatellia bacterium]
MGTSELFKRMRGLRIIVVFLAMLLAYGGLSYSPQASTPMRTFSVGLNGATGATNNTALAYGRYVLIAPFWPSTGVDENGELNVPLLDNRFIYLIDTKKPNSDPIFKELSAWDSKREATKTVYFPTKVVFDPESGNVYVRGTRFEETDRGLVPIDVIAYVHLEVDEDGRIVFDTNVIPIDIRGVSDDHASEAPRDFALSAKGDLLVFTNGASIFSYNLAEGYLYSAEIVHPNKYSEDDSISFLDVDKATNIVSVCWNTKIVGKDKVAKVSSELSFYSLGEGGTFDLLKRAYADQLPEGTALANGSNIAIVPATEKDDSNFALFATNDGSVCTVELRDDGVTTAVKRLYGFPELAQSDPADTNPLLVNYDAARRVIGIVKPGFRVQISRPSNGRPGRISRPSNVHIASGTPVLAMARLGKKNKVASANAISDVFRDEGGLSNVVNAQNSRWLISTYSGKLFSVEVANELQSSTAELVGSVGSRVDRIAYYSDRASIVAINSFTLEDDGMRVASPGALVLARMSDLETQTGSVLQALLPTASVLGKPAPSIRRPCNVKR